MDCVPASEFEAAYAEYARTMVVVSGFDGTPALNAALVHEHIDRVELTTDNWREYIKVYQYDDYFDEQAGRIESVPKRAAKKKETRERAAEADDEDIDF